jgi:hypothetical protein
MFFKQRDDAGDGAAVLLMPSSGQVQQAPAPAHAPAPAPSARNNQQFHKDDQPAAPATLQPSSFKSSCSLAADLRGPHQKVIGYSIYGDFSQTATADRYLTPLAETLKDIALAYPGIYLLYSLIPASPIMAVDVQLNNACWPWPYDII